MEVIGKFGSRSQRERWLAPLLLGQSKSCFAMTESAVASSDPTQLAATAVLVPKLDNAGIDKSYWRIDGQKWWTTVMH